MLASHVAEFEITAPAAQQAPPQTHRHYPPHPMVSHYPPQHYGQLPGPGQTAVKPEPMDNRFLLSGPSYALPALPGPQIPGQARPGQPMMTYPGPTARSYMPPQPTSSTAPQQRIPQVDGPSSSGSESPSPPNSGYAPHSNHPSLPQPAQASSSKPLDAEAINSDLDDSDSEEEEEAQEEGPGEGDIVFCTYDKVCYFSIILRRS